MSAMPLPLGSEPSRCPTHHSYSIAFDALPLRLTAFASFLSPSDAFPSHTAPRLAFASRLSAKPCLCFSALILFCTKRFHCRTGLSNSSAILCLSTPWRFNAMRSHALAALGRAMPLLIHSMLFQCAPSLCLCTSALLSALPWLRFSLLILCCSVQNSTTQGGANPLRSSVCRTIIVPKTSEVNCK